MREMFRIMKERLSGGESLCLVTVLDSVGSTPRGKGSRMLVAREGRIAGTIGGGAIEHRSREMAQEVIAAGQSTEHRFSLNKTDLENLGMICGGAARVFFRYLPAGDEATLALCDQALALYQAGADIWLNEGESLALYTENPGAGLAGCTEQINSTGRVYIFGGGHVGQALAPVLASVGFRVTVLDDRPEYADAALFPSAEEVIVCDFEHLDRSITLSDQDYCCVMTRGHAHDMVVEAQLLRSPVCYIGVIGSRSKKAGVDKRLVEEFGIPEDQIPRIVSPIGLSIRAETPAEIAVSIAGQMIQHRAERRMNGTC